MTPRIVWLASYPKSGNTWFRAVFVAWRVGGPVELGRLRTRGLGSMGSERSRIERALGVPSSLLTPDEVDLLRPRVDEVMGGIWDEAADDDEPTPESGVDASPSPSRISKLHDALFPGPSGEPIVSIAATRGVIYVVRDPRDVAVSLAHHNGWRHERAVDQMADPEAAMSGGERGVPLQVRQRLGTWSEHVRSWLDQRLVPVHPVRYEDCHRAPAETFGAAFRFAGFDAEADDVAAAAEIVRFDRLRAQEEESGFPERSQEADRFFRRGEVGAWRDELAPELAERIEIDHGEVMRRLGYLPDPAPGAGPG